MPAPSKRLSRNSRSTSPAPVKIPVTVVPTDPNTPPPVRPKAVAPRVNTLAPMTRPKAPSRSRLETWPEHHRRKVMWWMVGGAMVVIIAGWTFLLGSELRKNPGGQNFFHDVVQAFKDFRFPQRPAADTGQQEIRNLDQQVFPQFEQ